MQQQDPEIEAGEGSTSVNKRFGDVVKASREARGWSQRQLAEMLRAVDLKLDPSAITRIERGNRDVKLAEAIAIASVLEFDVLDLHHSPEGEFEMREFAQVQMMVDARKALLVALRHIDRWVNHTDPDTEDRLIERRSLKNHVDLYTYRFSQSPAFMRNGKLLPDNAANFAVYVNGQDRRVKQAIVDAVINGILISEDELLDGGEK